MWGWKIFGLVFFLNVSGSVGDPQPLSLKFCCPDGQDVITTQQRTAFGPRTTAKCVSSSSTSLNGETILVLDPSKSVDDRDRFVLRSIEKADEVGGISCGRSIHSSLLPLGDNRPEGGSGGSRRRDQGDTRITLRDGDSPNEGNIYINGDPVCDDGWGQDEANVACRMAGYPGGGSPTRETRWRPYRSTSNFRMDNVDCNGYEDSLFDCSYRSEDDCSASEYAGVVCGDGGPAPGSIPTENLTLALNGDLMTSSGRQEAGSFCISRASGSSNRNRDYGPYGDYQPMEYRGSSSFGDTSIKAYACEQPSQVIPFLLKTLWDGMGFDRYDDNQYDRALNIRLRYFRKMADKDNSGTTTYEEFMETIDDKIKLLFYIFDANEDGELEPDTEGKTLSALPFKLFNDVAETLFNLLDYSKDNVLSFTDDIVSPDGTVHNNDRNGDGHLSLEVIFYAHPSTWPQVLQNLKDLIDPNGDENLSKEEAFDFITRTITAFDSNKDCKITSDEIANLISSLEGFPFGYGIAIKTFFDQYSNAFNYVIPEILKKADKNQDQKTSLVELMEMDDWDWLMDELIPAAILLGYPSESYRFIFASDVRHEVRRRWENEHRFAQKLMEGLSNLLREEAFTGSVDTTCRSG